MEFEQFLKENPAAKFEYEQNMNKNFEAGLKKGMETMTTKMNAVAKYLTPGSKYGNAVKSAAVDVLTGEKPVDYLDMLATAVEAMKESANSSAAQTETGLIPDVPASPGPVASQNGDILTNDDFEADVARMKSQYGLEV